MEPGVQLRDGLDTLALHLLLDTGQVGQRLRWHRVRTGACDDIVAVLVCLRSDIVVVDWGTRGRTFLHECIGLRRAETGRDGLSGVRLRTVVPLLRIRDQSTVKKPKKKERKGKRKDYAPWDR